MTFFGFGTLRDLGPGTWDLTSLAVIDGFPASWVPVDLAWGAVLASTVAGFTTLAVRRTHGLPELHPPTAMVPKTRG